MTITPSRRITRWACVALLAVAVAGVTACSDHDQSTSSSKATTAVLPPAVVAIDAIDGTTVEIRPHGTVDLNVPAGSATDGWSADVADPTVVRFVPGSVSDGAVYNPGLVGERAGETSVTLTDAASSMTVTFTVRVSES